MGIKRLFCILLYGIGIPVFLVLCVWLIQFGTRRYEQSFYPVYYSELVETAAEEFSLPPSLIYAVIRTESGFSPQAVSAADAKGLMQLTDSTYLWALRRAGKGSEYDPQKLFDPATNIHYGTYVLFLLGEQFENTDTVLAAYNAGQGQVRHWLADPSVSADGKHLDTIPFPETQTYVRRVQEARERYQQLYSIP